jgi:hypothetical protein
MNVVIVVPYFLRASVQFLEGAVGLPKVRLTLICEDAPERLSQTLRDQIHEIRRVSGVMDPLKLEQALTTFTREVGQIDRLLGIMEELQIPLARIRDRLRIPGMGEEVALNFRDKSRMKQILRNNNIPCAKHCLATNPEQALQFAKDVGLPLVVKPPAGAGSRDTFQVETEAELKTVLAHNNPSPQRPLLFEEFIMGNEHTFESVFVGGKMVWHSITRYFPTPLQVLKNPWIQWCIILPREIDHPHFDDIRHVATVGNRTLGLTDGLSHLEWFRRVDGTIAISEVGARPPGGQLTSITGFAHDFNIHRAWAELMVFGTWPKLERKYATGAAFIRGQGEGRIRAIYGLRQIQKELGHIIVETKVPQIGQPGSSTYTGDGYILLRHPVTGVIEKALDRIINTIRVVRS